ncbi:unnamed protein product [Psylliodes chrysocephalus]|uniref:Uncharacterized protein n=1 Tax=Psylliodes chrysocephalus TaxID=3402493 RepID=A0A9P0D2A6_9CUCU|nr:unnamed protein product [Psylliodes chrysocephala]
MPCCVIRSCSSDRRFCEKSTRITFHRNADEPHRMRQLVKVPYNKPPPRQRMYISRDGVVRDSIVDGSVPTRNPAPEDNPNVLLDVQDYPKTSTYERSRNYGISRKTVQNIFNKNKFHPYIIQNHQEIVEDDFNNYN